MPVDIKLTREFKSSSQEYIDSEKIHCIIKEAIGSDVELVCIETAKQGNINSSYIVHTREPEARLFLKIENHSRVPLFYNGQIEREVVGRNLLKEADIPCSNTLHYDFSKRDIGVKYILTDYVDASLLSDVWTSLDDTEKSVLKYKILDIVEKMKAIRSGYFGDLFENGSFGKHSTWAGAFKAMIETAIFDCCNMSTFTQDEAGILKQAVNKCYPELNTKYDPCYNHMDIHWHNVLVNGRGSEIKISAVLDFGSSVFGPTFSDEYRLNKGFLIGTEKFYNEKMPPKFSLNRDEEFFNKLLASLDYYVFLSLIRNDDCSMRERIVKNCISYIGG